MWGSLGQKRRWRRRWKRRQRVKLMPIPPRTPLPLKTWYPRLKLLNPSPRLTRRKILINHKLRYRVLALFLRFLYLPRAFWCNTYIYHLMKAFIFLSDLDFEWYYEWLQGIIISSLINNVDNRYWVIYLFQLNAIHPNCNLILLYQRSSSIQINNILSVLLWTQEYLEF